MKTTTTETAIADIAAALATAYAATRCHICGKPYRGTNTVPVNQGYGRYVSKPAHVRCERNWT